METLWQDLRYGSRMLIKKPGFTAVAVLVLALGIGANTGIFSLIDAVLLKMLPVKAPERLVALAISATCSGRQQTRFSYPLFEDLRDRNEVFSGMFVYNPVGLSMSAGDQPERVRGELVSGNFFSVLGVNAHLGRVFSQEDDQKTGAHTVTVISYGFWQRRFAGDPSLVGRTIRLNNYPFTVIGIAPAGFFGIQVGSSPDIWVPITTLPHILPQASPLNMREASWLPIMARLKPDITEQQAKAALDTFFQQIRQEQGQGKVNKPSEERHIQLLAGSKGMSSLRQQFSKPLVILMTVVGLVLLIACANVANLLLARATARKKEIAVRLAIGAGRARLIQQLLTESLLLSLLGGMLGLVFAFGGTDLLLSFLPRGRFVLEIKPDLRVLAFTLAVSVATGILFGLAPALQATRLDLVSALKSEVSVLAKGARRLELRKALVVSQVALSLVLLIGAGLFIRTLGNLKGMDAGFSGDKVLLLSVDPRQIGYGPSQVKSFYTQLIERVQALPDVRSASLAFRGPLGVGSAREDIYPPGHQPRPGEDLFSAVDYADPRFFETMGIPLLLGRDFSLRDNETASKVAIINEAFARDFFGNQSPIGRRIGIGGQPDFEIIGVVKATKYSSLREDSPRAVYRSFLQFPGSDRTLYVRTAGDPNRLIASVRREVQALDKDLPVFNVKTFSEQVNESLVQERLTATLSSFFGLLALLLASIGLYGVMAYSVIGRTREIGIRMALGAEPRAVLWMVMRETLLLVMIGVALGLPAALAAARLVSGMLFGLTSTDPVTIATATLLLAAVAALSGYLPARRATKIDPMVALRYE